MVVKRCYCYYFYFIIFFIVLLLLFLIVVVVVVVIVVVVVVVVVLSAHTLMQRSVSVNGNKHLHKQKSVGLKMASSGSEKLGAMTGGGL